MARSALQSLHILHSSGIGAAEKFLDVFECSLAASNSAKY